MAAMEMVKTQLMVFVVLGVCGQAKAVSPPPPNVVDPVGPVIGILDQDYGEDRFTKGNVAATTERTYIAASYVKHIEGAGGRVVPLHYKDSLENLTDKFGKINGILFPGGGMDLKSFETPYMKAVWHLWNLAITANRKGDFFPVWGTCLGFETISVLGANNSEVLIDGFDSEDLPLALQLTPAASQSRMLGQAPTDIVNWMTNTNSTMNNHRSGVSPSQFSSNKNLDAFYTVLSTNLDREGKAFTSTIEGKTMPVYGTQWHPEKNIFEWTNREAIPHTSQAIAIAQYVANFFISEARKSTHHYPYDELTSDVIWNSQPTYTFKEGSNFEQDYIWPQ